MNYTHIPLKHGHATFEGDDFKPSKELMEALNRMAEIAYNECNKFHYNNEKEVCPNCDSIQKPWILIDKSCSKCHNKY